jgi:diguanylate cyclase (GGDEF)-like protein/PAS domain S-box-containing protein
MIHLRIENLKPDTSGQEYAAQRFHEIFEATPIACVCYDDRGRIFTWNNAFECQMALKDPDPAPERQKVLLAIESVHLSPKRVECVFAGGVEDWKECEEISDVRHSTLRLAADFPLCQPNGKVIAGIHAIVDVTQVVRVQPDAAGVGGSFACGIVSDADAHIGIGDDDHIASWNQGAASTFGYPSEEAIGQPITFLIPDLYDHAGADKAEGEPCVGCHFAGKTVEVYGRRKGGSLFPASVSVVAHEMPQGRLVMAIVRDVTHQKHAEWRLRKEVDDIKSRNLELHLQKGELESDNHKLEILARVDPMTGLKNRRAFQERLALEFHRAGRYLVPLSLLLLDIDHFKPYNDTYGHPAGDRVLMQLAHILVQNARGVDFVVRFGGEEFAVILPHTAEMGALTIAERFRQAISMADWPHRTITASFGAATLTPGSGDTETLIAEADKALYLSKSRGRNCVTHFGEALKQS